MSTASINKGKENDMDKKKLEQKLANQRRSRRLEIWEKIATVVCIIFILWIVASTVEVWYHNDQWFGSGKVTTYCPLNFWKLLIELANTYVFRKIRGEV